MALGLSRLTRTKRTLDLPPPAVLVLIYAALIATGTLFLSLPFAHYGAVGFMDALFISASAVTVTGLVVVDPGSDFTLFGQIVIAMLIQAGGLGLMTFAVLILGALGLPIGMSQRIILREDLNQTSVANVFVLVRILIVVALGCEAVGAVLLAIVFVPEFGWSHGIWQSIFHSISAFNNAGFSLFSTSLAEYVADPLVNVVVPVMFISGGLGFVVWADVYQKRRFRKLSVHSKITLVGSLILIVSAWVLYTMMEWSNPATLGGLESIAAKLQASWFQAVTPRTAGFNTLDTSAHSDSTALMTMMLMVIGGGSASTAGGIKVTTAVVLLLATIAFFNRQKELHVFGRSLGLETVLKVMALTTISVLVLLSGLFLLTLTHDLPFLVLAFEVTSAFGTVGMSMGATGELDTFGQLIIIAIMFLGRVGPLTVGFFLATQSAPRVRYPRGEIYLG